MPSAWDSIPLDSSAPKEPASTAAAPVGGSAWDSIPLAGDKKPAHPHDPNIIQRGIAGLQWMANSPVAHGLDTVLNAGSRAGTAALAGKNPIKAIADPAAATETTHAAETNVLHNIMHIPEIPASWWQGPMGAALRVGQVGLDLLTETGADPTMYIPGLDAWSLARHIGSAAKRVPGAIEAGERIGKAIEPATSRIANAFSEGRALRQDVTRSGEDVVKGHEIAGKDVVRRSEGGYGALIDKYAEQLDGIGEKRAGLRAQLAEIKPLLDQRMASDKVKAQANGILEQLNDLKKQVPQEIRDAFDQRAYREGTPEVRRKVMAAGYKPTAEDVRSPVLNILHKYESDYEPEHTLFKPEDNQLGAGPVRYVGQGNRKASFDLPKMGANPEDPLSLRMLDRLVRGARIAGYHETRRNILQDTGILARTTPANMQETLGRIAAANLAGDEKRAARYEAVLQAQDAELKRAEALREQHFKDNPDAKPAEQQLEVLDPKTANLRAEKEAERAGTIERRIDPRTGKVVKSVPTTADIRLLEGRASGGKRAVIDAEQFQKVAQQGAERTAKGVKRAENVFRKAGDETVDLSKLATPSARVAELVGARTSGVFRRTSEIQGRLQSAKQLHDAMGEVAARAQQMGENANVLHMPEQLQKRLFAAKAVYEKSLARYFSDLQRDALFIIPYAHMKNITILALLGPKGLKTVLQGMRYARQLKTNPEALEHRVRGLEQIGASSHYIKDVEPVYAKAGKPGQMLADFAERGNAALERYDMGMRMALEDELKAQGKVGFTAGGQIRDILGDYENQAPAIKELRNRLGANFPAWRLGIVPRAMTKALREQPKAMKTYARLERLFSDDVSQPLLGADFDLGGPVEDYGQMLFPKPSPSNFYTSESTIGPARAALDMAAAAPKGQLGQVAGREALRVLPGGALVSAVSGFPYPSNVPAGVRGAAGLVGGYFPNKQTIKQRYAQLQALGMKRPQIQAILESEGYYRASGAGAAQAPAEGAPAPASGGSSWDNIPVQPLR